MKRNAVSVSATRHAGDDPAVKLIHTADVHLDAPNATLGERAAELRRTVRETFTRVVDMCLERDAQVFIIAGDLFDSRTPPREVIAKELRAAVDQAIASLEPIYREALGGYGAAEAWYIRDAERSYPDLRRLANPGQLRLAAAWHTLEIALGAAHTRASPTMYSELRDYFRSRYEEAMRSLVLAIKSGSGDNATSAATAVGRRLSRV